MPECSADPRPAMTTPTGELGTGRRTASPTTGSPGTRSHPSGPWTHGRTHGRAHAQCQHQHHQPQHHHHDQLINVRCTSSSPVPPASAERNQANPRRPSPYFFLFYTGFHPKKTSFGAVSLARRSIGWSQVATGGSFFDRVRLCCSRQWKCRRRRHRTDCARDGSVYVAAAGGVKQLAATDTRTSTECGTSAGAP